jgi:nicotinate-nucleotide adenylyltransferase
LSSRAPRIGVFGGAFDPPHRAHRALAETARRELRLDRLHVLPTGQAWHRSQAPVAAIHRLAMSRLAFDDLDGVCVDDRELHRTGPTYTVDTLLELHAAHPDAELVLVLGEDQARALTSWHRWPEVLALAELAIAVRPSGTGALAPAFVLGQLPPGARAHLLPLPAMPVSATDIRARVAAGTGIDHLVGPAVAGYIARHHLYQPA